jgi:hypothetical protein
MQDVYLPIADVLARPLRHVKRRSGAVVLLYQLWRADFAALARLSFTCREAAVAVRRLLWVSTPLGQRERARRAQVERARAFMRLPAVATFLVSASWRRSHGVTSGGDHIRSRMSLAFNGRLRLREYCFPGRCERRWLRYCGLKARSPLVTCVGITLTDAERGRVLVWLRDAESAFSTGTFTDHDSALGGLRWKTFLGHEYWDQLQPLRHDRFRRYSGRALGANLEFRRVVFDR